MSLLQEFKEFAMRGNVVDLAVGIVIGAAFTAIVSALVESIITPLLGIIVGGVDFSGLAVTVGDEAVEYGKFIQATFDFIIIAFAIFMVIKLINKLRMEKAEDPAPEPVKQSPEETLLTEIRDLLKAQQQS